MYRRNLAVLVGLILALALSWPALAGNTVKAVRLWPSPDYTRITVELADAPRYKYFSLGNPNRIVIDLRDVEMSPLLQTLADQVGPGDPVVSTVRAALNQPGVVRLVAELKGEAKPQVFTLEPMGEYGHRLVLDLYPAGPAPAQPGIAKQVEDAIAQASQADAAPAARPAPVAAAKPAPVAAAAADDKATVQAPAKPATAAKSQYIRLVTVAIDAGHGGEDPGALGANGSQEKDITLAVARRLKAHIDRQENMRAVLIRDGDYFIPLHERVNKARRAQADLFVSIHADAYLKSSASGSSVFALSEKGATSAAARWLAKRENDADLIGGVNIDVKDVYLKKTLISLSQDAQIRDSLVLGRAVLDELGGINNLHRGHVEQAGFAVLKAPDIPSVLIETAFISNPDEEKRLLDEAYQDKMAEAIVGGIKRYFDNNPPLAKAKVAQNL
ncbi:N-acetylmuramoyl-L-alanine amidase [Parasulfuritortus cantonensis]|uniref:N-acetylmuramoyl-L-alanine amidase AmiC n=1 Tax=Parasulfuritortus cantonensis TaxID=2528202 RepID=A0A4R1BHE7_9PROT|nr:N-acetylmuramoyl-L-alanine amidase [Parasulfuritortus cantonensis]TCJ16597.1 N-acetylmuramoyl-L-alanine amidase [Parasulfuritortus cantonensis]